MIRLHNPKTPFEQLREKGIDFLEPSYKWKEFEHKGIKIINNKRVIKNSFDIQDVFGFDTETYQGTCRLLARSDGTSKYILNPNFMECLDFLFYNAGNSHVWRFFYNIDFDYNAIIKLCDDKEKINNLNNGIEVCFNEYKMLYLKGSMLILRKGKKRVVITDLFRIFSMSLNTASSKFLVKECKDDIDGNLLNNSLSYWNENLERIIDYCIKDCILVKKLGLLFLQALKDDDITVPKYLCSPASISKAHFRKNCYIPKLSEIPIEIQKIGFDCYYGGRFELLKRGTFKKGYCYDVNSEYPEILSRLPSLKYGLWVKIKELPKKECLGYFRAKILLPDDNLISTIPVRYKGMIKFPNGYFEKWFTWYDLDLIREYIIEIIDGYVYMRSKIEYNVFQKEIFNLYEKKARYKGNNDLLYRINKLTMNALYGCCFEIHKKKYENGMIEKSTGILFNSVYASQITAFGRWKILKDVWQYKDKLIAFHTDSIISEIDLSKILTIDDKLGNWNLENSGKLFIINTGMYQISNKKYNMIKTRGVPIKYINNWFEFSKENATLSKKEFSIKRMTKLSQALKQYKDINMVNIMNDNKKTININSDNKRHWFDKFDDFNDVLNKQIESLPLIAISLYDFTDLFPNPLCY